MSIMLPDWLEWVLNEVLGMDWPTADEDKLFEAANLWRQFATDVQGIQYTGVTAAGNVISENYGDSIDGFKGTWDKFSGNGSGYLDDAQTVALVVAGVLDAAGAIVIAAKAAVIVQLAILAAEIIAAQAAAPFTFGLSELGAAGATQATKMIVRRLLKELKDALIEAIVEAMKEPAISALEAIITDLISQSLNVNFGAQKGINVGQTLKAGSDAAVDQLKNTPQTIAEGVRDNLGGKAGHSAHHAIDSRNGHGDSSSSDGDGSSSTSSSTSTDSTNSSDSNSSSDSSSSTSSTTTTHSDGNSGPTTTSPTSPLANGNGNGNTTTSSDSTPPTLPSTSTPDATPPTTPDSTAVPAPAASPVTHSADNYTPSPFDPQASTDTPSATDSTPTSNPDSTPTATPSDSPTPAHDSTPAHDTTPSADSPPHATSSDSAPHSPNPTSYTPTHATDTTAHNVRTQSDSIASPDLSQHYTPTHQSGDTGPTPHQSQSSNSGMPSSPNLDSAGSGTSSRPSTTGGTSAPTTSGGSNTQISSPNTAAAGTPSSTPSSSSTPSRTTTPSSTPVTSPSPTTGGTPSSTSPSTNTGTPSSTSTPSNNPPNTTPGQNTPGNTTPTPTTPPRQAPPAQQPPTGQSPDRPAGDTPNSRPQQPPQGQGQQTPQTQQPSTTTPPPPVHVHATVPAQTPAHAQQHQPNNGQQPPTRPTSDSRPYDQPGGVEGPRPDDQNALESHIPRDDNGDPVRHPDPNDGSWTEHINGTDPTEPGRNNNCVDTALSTVDTYSGNPTAAASRTPDIDSDGNPSDRGETGGRDRIENTLGAKFSDLGNGHDAFTRLESTLRDSGHGSQAVIITSDSNGRAHAWNAVNHNGDITYVDAQTGQRSNTPLHNGDNGVFAVPLDPNRRPVTPADPTPGTNRPADSRPATTDRRPDATPAGVKRDQPDTTDDREEGPSTKRQHGEGETSEEKRRKDRNASLPAPETVTQTQSTLPPDASQAAVRNHVAGGNPVHRIELNPVQAQMRRWAADDRAPLAQLMERAAERRAAYDDATESTRKTRKELTAAKKEVTAARKAVKDAQKGSAQDRTNAAQRLANAETARDAADATHQAARQALRDSGETVPPTAFTERELREVLGDDFARMNDGQRYAVVATMARMSQAFHADNSVGRSPEPALDGNSAYEGASNMRSGDPNPARDYDDISVAAERRADAQNKFPAEYRREGSAADTALKDLQNETQNATGQSNKPSITDLLENAEQNTPDFSDKNYAVVELVDADGNSTYVVDSSIPSQDDGVSPRHSETHLLDWVDRLNSSKASAGQPGYEIAGLYTEREPCGLRKGNSGHADCSQAIRDSQAMHRKPVYYSTTYRVDSGRKAVQQALRAQMTAQGLPASEIKTAVKNARTDNEHEMTEQMHDHLRVVGEVWARARIQMVRREHGLDDQMDVDAQ